MATDTIRRRAPTSSLKEEKDDDDQTLYEPPDGVPAGTIFFRYNRFEHNSRLALFMVPCASLLTIFGGQTTIASVVGGILIIYLLDFYGWKESTFVAIWVTVTTVVMTLIMSSLHLFSISIFNIALVYNMLIFACGVGLWATLQFSFLQQQHPRMILIFERLLFAVMPSSPPIIMTWAAIATYGMESAPYFLMVFLGIGYALYVLPTRSSFRVLGKGRSRKLQPEMDELDELVMGRFESAVHTVSFVMLPLFFKYAIHHAHILDTRDDVADLLLLASLPLLVVASLAGRGSLWWLGLPAAAVATVRRALVALLVLVVVGCLEARVVFHSLSQYIKVTPPWDVIAVTGGVYLAAVLVLMHFGGWLESPRMMPAATGLGGAAIGCLCVALGVPGYMVPFGCAGSFFCARFYYHRRLQDYCSFVGTAALVIFWFVIRTFMFLDFEFDPLPMSLRHVCLVLMAVVLASLLIPGLVSVCKVLAVNGAVLCVHAAGVCVIELQLHCQFEGIYPSYLVAFTSAVGLYLAHHLHAEGKAPRAAAWLMGCLYAGKLGLLMHPTPLALPASLLLVLAISPIYLGVLFLRAPAVGGAGAAAVQGPKMTKAEAVGLLLGSAAALLAARHSVVAAAVRATVHHAPPESLLLGVVAVLWTAACSGLFAYHFPQSAKLRQTFAVLLCVGAALVIIQPDMEFVRPWSPIRTVPPPAARRRGVAGAAGGVGDAPAWASWCLFASAVAALVLAGGAARRSAALRGALAAAAGCGAGLYFDGAFLPYSGTLYATSGLACALAAAFVASVPSAGGGGAPGQLGGGGGLYLQGVFTAFVGLLPVALMMQPIFLRGVVASARGEAVDAHRVGFMGLYVVLSVLIAFTIKLQAQRLEAAAAGGGARARADAAGGGAGAAARPRPAVVAAARGEWEWLPAAGNLATVLGYGLALTIAKGYMDAPDEVVVGLAPMLLLLSQDGGLLSGLTDRQRYFPLVAASVGWLVAAAVFRLALREPLERYHVIPRSQGPFPETASVLAQAKNLGLLAVVLPGHVMFGRFMWYFRQTRDIYWVLLLPLNVLPIMLADLPCLRLLAALALAAGGLQLFLSSRIRKFGLQFV